MHPNAVHHRLSAQISEVETRTNARLDTLEAKINQILRAAGLPGAPAELASEAVEVLDRDGRPVLTDQSKPTRPAAGRKSPPTPA